MTMGPVLLDQLMIPFPIPLTFLPLVNIRFPGALLVFSYRYFDQITRPKGGKKRT